MIYWVSVKPVTYRYTIRKDLNINIIAPPTIIIFLMDIIEEKHVSTPIEKKTKGAA